MKSGLYPIFVVSCGRISYPLELGNLFLIVRYELKYISLSINFILDTHRDIFFPKGNKSVFCIYKNFDLSFGPKEQECRNFLQKFNTLVGFLISLLSRFFGKTGQKEKIIVLLLS